MEQQTPEEVEEVHGLITAIITRKKVELVVLE
jgi:hypothetical protein